MAMKYTGLEFADNSSNVSSGYKKKFFVIRENSLGEEYRSNFNPYYPGALTDHHPIDCHLLETPYSLKGKSEFHRMNSHECIKREKRRQPRIELGTLLASKHDLDKIQQK
ncbi:uncharacterized protein ACOB8E_024936 isoform 2-T2 [Sarcophilus harrisii]